MRRQPAKSRDEWWDGGWIATVGPGITLSEKDKNGKETKRTQQSSAFPTAFSALSIPASVPSKKPRYTVPR